MTGAAGYSLDAIKVFGNINGSLLLVAALIVLILLIAIYRSPIFWIIPFFTVLLAEGAARGRRVPARRGGRDRSTASPAGSCPCWCSAPAPTTRCCSSRATARSCAATRTSTRRWRSRCGAPARRSSPPGLTVIAALLTLSARRGQRHRRARADRRDGRRAGDDLDAHDAAGRADDLRARLVLAAHPAPRRGRAWTRRTASGGGSASASRSARAQSGSPARSCCASSPPTCSNLDTGLTSGNSFRGEVDSVQGQEILARNFPAGASAPTDVIVPDRARAPAVAARWRAQGPREPGERAGREARPAHG